MDFRRAGHDDHGCRSSGGWRSGNHWRRRFTNAIGVALGVKLTTQLKLFSWSGFSGTAWHWIAIRGYSGYGTSTKRLYYNDSSSGWGGATGAYSDTLNLVWQVNQANTGNIVW
jgi:hypothetical protein